MLSIFVIKSLVRFFKCIKHGSNRKYFETSVVAEEKQFVFFGLGLANTNTEIYFLVSCYFGNFLDLDSKP